MAEFPGPDLLGLMLTNSISMRAEHYRRQAAQFRAMAETQIDAELHRQLLELAEGYDELSTNCADQRI